MAENTRGRAIFKISPFIPNLSVEKQKNVWYYKNIKKTRRREMKNKAKGSFFPALVLFSLTGQIAWVMENMYLNVFIYKIFGASPADISLMVAASAVAATLTTVFIGALSDRMGKRKFFICGGYIAWGISILAFSLIRTDLITGLFPAAASAASVGIALVIIADCIMTFFGSSANDAAFNAWMTDMTDGGDRGAAEGINAMMPLVAILVVFGGFMFFDLSLQRSWTYIFVMIGIAVTVIGFLGIFMIKEPKLKPDRSGYFKTVFYGFSPRSFSENKPLYLSMLLFTVFNVSIQIFMPYLIIYYEVSLGMSDYVFIMAPAIVIASAVTALWGRVYDKKGFRFAAICPLTALILGYLILFVGTATAPVFIGSLLMMCGYLSGAAAFGAVLREKTPEGKAGRLQGIRIFTQVLLPGVIGPFIGKTVLSGAKTVVGSDGTSSFIPSADIFAAAAIPALALLIFLLLFKGKKKRQTCELKTDYTPTDPPHDYHPNPMFKRESYTNLNGKWSFSVENGEGAVYSGEITVPFPPESALSGVKRLTSRGERLIYQRSFTAKKEGRCLLHFGACDNEAKVLVNGLGAGEHIGGYLPFTLDITELIKEGENTLTVIARDSLDTTYPYGKQSRDPSGMWYTPVSGIWQTVWLENVPENYIREIKTEVTLSSVTLKVTGGENEKIFILDGKEYPFTGEEFTLGIESPKLWTPEEPNLYYFTLKSGGDRVDSYFALRTVESVKVGKKSLLALNGRPYFFHGLLDQGYYPDGIFTPADKRAFEDDILRMKHLGFNMLRKHIKLEPQIFYYLCDLHGMAVFQDMINNGKYSFIYDTALPTVGFKKLPKRQSKAVRAVFYDTAKEMISLLDPHPSVLYYTIFNEGWGQHDGRTAYNTLKPLAKNKIFDTASGWFCGVPSDVKSEHIYFKRADIKIDPERPTVLSEFGGYSHNIEGHVFNPHKTYGYKICKSQRELSDELDRLYTDEIIPLAKKGLCASVLTQLSDVEDETNGMLTYDRKELKPDPDVMRNIAGRLFCAFSEGVDKTE